MPDVTSLAELEALYGDVPPAAMAKETDRLTAEYRAWIEQAPFFAIASVGAAGTDCSPRGDKAGHMLRVLDDRTIAIPDRRGNNRIDTLRNIVADQRVSLLFLIPGVEETLRIRGRAKLSTDPALTGMFEMGGKKPVTVIVVDITSVFFQCARALKRAGLWDRESLRQKGDVPTAGQMLKSAVEGFDGDSYDAQLEDRLKATLY